MVWKRCFSGLAGLITLSVIALAATPIVWKPTVGAEYRFKWVATSEDYPGPSGLTSIRQEEVDHHLIKQADPGGDVVTSVEISEIKAAMGDKSVQPANPSAVIKETLVQRKDGLILSKRSDSAADVTDPRIEAMDRFVYPDHPINIGDKWVYSEQADKQKGTQDNQSTYTYLGRELVSGIPCYKIGLQYREIGILLAIRAEGTIWISSEDTELVKKDILGENLTIAGGASAFKLRLQTERITDSKG